MTKPQTYNTPELHRNVDFRDKRWDLCFVFSENSSCDIAGCHNDFYVYGSVHRWSILITVQRDATQSSLFIILQVHSTCFWCWPHPSSGIHRTVTTASGSGHITFLQRGHTILATLEGGSCTVPEAVVTVLCTPDDGCRRHSKHVE